MTFCDHAESRVRGRLLHTAGKEQDCDKFCGTLFFVDAASGWIGTEHQVSLGATDTILAKESYERKAASMGVKCCPILSH